ncbi:hypothetical protein M406DRAFT_335218 [Cryphonectria parasitica EP155]|uniref:Uncharacterized protein n=1 Tax=Cryphonectria parasitica (strain ATCC 38755 / EP155) TaxID=660469 RepID=A0A9P5CJ95_CRYP1|nr:uncharacterized protein M406DRAFT_335218 [Cryphonectria parasitica EP155]KAF3760007.1 hypothetical protein M406DRAFT_335218 [Cryphonectria parasitica EP155]
MVLCISIPKSKKTTAKKTSEDAPIGRSNIITSVSGSPDPDAALQQAKRNKTRQEPPSAESLSTTDMSKSTDVSTLGGNSMVTSITTNSSSSSMVVSSRTSYSGETVQTGEAVQNEKAVQKGNMVGEDGVVMSGGKNIRSGDGSQQR